MSTHTWLKKVCYWDLLPKFLKLNPYTHFDFKPVLPLKSTGYCKIRVSTTVAMKGEDTKRFLLVVVKIVEIDGNYIKVIDCG